MVRMDFTAWPFSCVALLLLLTLTQWQCDGETIEQSIPDDLNFYSYTVMDIEDNIVSLDLYKGKVSLVVNVASKCGYTEGHYRELNTLMNMFRDAKKFTVLAFPCNQFGKQEPGSHKDIFKFAYQKMQATFPLFAKINVKDENVPPAWNYLIKKSGSVPTWNFWKYLVDHNGHVINAWGPTTSPELLYQDVRQAVTKAQEAAKAKKKKKSKKKKEKKVDGKEQEKMKKEEKKEEKEKVKGKKPKQAREEL